MSESKGQGSETERATPTGELDDESGDEMDTEGKLKIVYSAL